MRARQTIGLALIVVGIVLIVSGVFLTTYRCISRIPTALNTTVYVYPYRAMGIVLLILGVILLIIGILLLVIKLER